VMPLQAALPVRRIARHATLSSGYARLLTPFPLASVDDVDG
jgi:hypothetical protein